MKKLATLLIICVITAAGAVAVERIIQTHLPEAAQQFMDKYYAGQSVMKVEKDYDHGTYTYEVDYYNGGEIEFTADGTWTDVKAPRGTKVPADLVPDAIEKYVAANHPGRSIVDISKKVYGYEIELSDGIDLKLTAEAGPVVRR